MTFPPVDKIAHFLGGYAIALTLLTTHVAFIRLPWNPLIALLIVFLVGVGKEVYDGPKETMTSHIHDVLITTAGGALALAVNLFN
jgi:hypothetical protein